MGTTGQSITLANSIIGVGILAMPFCFQQCGVLLATVILLFMGLVSRLCCYFLLKSALLARRRTFEFLAFHVFGSAGKLAVEIGIIGFLMGTCIAYFVVVGDLGPQIISKMFNINQSDMLRTSIMVIVSLVCVLPLGLLRNVDSLSNVSAATIGFYFCLVMKVITEAGSQMLTTDWQSRVELWKPSGMLQCVPIFSMALFCQTQLFEIFESLPTLSLEKMNVVTKNAIHICASVYFTLGLFGYIAFSSQVISGNILMSLSPTMANDVIKLGFVMSVAFSFPLIIFPCRASLYSLLYKKVHSSHHDHIINHSIPESSFRCITVAIVGVALFISLLLPNIELVLGLVGSTIGVLICVVFPAACFVNVTFKNTNERVLAKGVLVLGLIIMVLGTYANLQAAENQLDKYDDKYITKERIDKIVEDFFEKMEKSDALVKPDIIKDDIIKDNNLETNKLNDEVIKESVVQPPNPVPPESQSNEKNHNNANDKDTSKLKEILPEPEKESVDKVSETHPKNLNKPNEAKVGNVINDNIENKNEKPKEEIKVPSNDVKINMIKQQQLIETIKQHGEEQKELIKEQKEILDEIKKTKQELQKNKNEAVNEEAKKIAVESIKKIANMAIQSLAGVSEKPGQVGDEKKSEQLEKLADEAVHEIAQKAVETIEAIKEIKEKPDPVANIPNVVKSKDNNVNSAPVHDNASQNKLSNPNPVSQESVQNNPAQQKWQVNNVVQQPNNGQLVNNGVPNVAGFVEKPLQNHRQADSNVGQEVSSASNIGQPAAKINKVAKTPVPEIKNPNSADNIVPIPHIAKPEIKFSPAAVNVDPKSNIVQPEVPSVGNQHNANAQIASNNDPKNKPVQQTINKKEQQNNPIPIETVKEHSHSPDEPQSYKEGEDSLKKIQEQDSLNKIIAANVPLPLAMNGINQVQNKNNEVKPISNNVQNTAQNNVQSNNQDTVIRQKREVVDCTEKMSLKPEDKEICNTLIDHPNKLAIKENDLLSAKVDFNDVGLPNKLPMQENIINHLRSLKSIDETNKNTR